MRKLTNPWIFQKDAGRRAEYAAEARERLADIATRPISAVLVRTSEACRFYRVLGTNPSGRPVGLASDIAGAAYDGKRVATLYLDIVEGSQGWLVRVNRDGLDGVHHIRMGLSHILKGKPGDYDITEF